MDKLTFKNFKFLLAIYLLSIFTFLIIRLALVYTETGLMNGVEGKGALLAKALFMGFRFDTVISGYILSLPIFALFVSSLFKWQNKIFYRVVFYYTLIVFLLSFLICIVNIPYFNQFLVHINVSVLNWTGNAGFVTKMIFQERSNWFFLIGYIVLVVCYVFIARKVYLKILLKRIDVDTKLAWLPLVRNFGIWLLIVGVTFLGIRGRISKKSPIRVGTAYFCNHSFFNQLGLNPVFVFMQSGLDYNKNKLQMFKLMDDEVAIKNASAYLSISDENRLFDSPIARQVVSDKKISRYNVVLVLMEGIASDYMMTINKQESFVPFLDSLAGKSYFFDHIFSAGIHTMNGVYGTFYSFPALLSQHPMSLAVVPEYTGIPKVLSANNYQTAFFVTHDEQFDNLGGFLLANSFQKVFSQKDYPSSQVLSTLGVPDHYMFEFSIPVLNRMAKANKPFFAAFLTSSNHIPIVIPEGVGFTPVRKDPRRQAVEYTDWSLKRFFHEASQQPWFDSTIFVFTADHGAPFLQNDYDMPIGYHHDPLIIYSKNIVPERFSCLGGQIDIFPTIMGLLNVNYVNNTMGIDLLKESRPYMYFSADNRIGCVDQNYFYVYHTTDGQEALYSYKKMDKTNMIGEYRPLADSMKNYALSMMQTTQWMILNKKTGEQALRTTAISKPELTKGTSIH